MEEICVGIDLSAKPENPSGWAKLVKLSENFRIDTRLLYRDEEIISHTLKFCPLIVAIDAPLSLPKPNVHFRKAEIELRKLGVSALPLSFRSIQTLSIRGYTLAENLRSRGIKVIEVYPNATRSILSLPSKKAEFRVQHLQKLGLETRKKYLTHHEVDAILSAYTAWLYVNGKAEKLGNEGEGEIVIPKSNLD